MSSPAVTQATGAPIVALVTTAETAILTTQALPVNSPSGQGVEVQATVTGATGASTTSVQIRVRQGSGTSGNVVGVVAQVAATASSFYAVSVAVLDTTVGVPSAPSGNPVYTVTIQQVAASGNGTATLANVAVEPANAAGG